MKHKWLVGTILTASLAVATTASAQYTGPGGMGGTGGTSGAGPTYTKRSYGVNKAAMAALIGGGIGGGLFLLKHHHRTLTACVSSDGKALDDGKDVYTIVGTSLTPGEHIVAAGKKVKADNGALGFQITSLRKDLGRCEQAAPTISAQK